MVSETNFLNIALLFFFSFFSTRSLNLFPFHLIIYNKAVLIWPHLVISSWLLPQILVSLSHIVKPLILHSGVRPPLWSGPWLHHSLFPSHILLLRPLHSLFSLPRGNLLNLNPVQLSLPHNGIPGEPYPNHQSSHHVSSLKGGTVFLFVLFCWCISNVYSHAWYR